MIPYRKRPGSGFLLLVATAVCSLVFVAWGLRTPPLEEVWAMHLELELGERQKLSHDEFDLFQDVLSRYPDLARTILEDADSGIISDNRRGIVDLGYAYAVRRSPLANGRLLIYSTTGKKIEMKMKTAASTVRGRATNGEPFSWRLPDEGPFPQLVEVSVQRSGKKKSKKNDSSDARPMMLEFR